MMLRRRDLLGSNEVQWKEYEATILSTGWQGTYFNGVSNVALEDACRYKIGPEGIVSVKVGAFPQANSDAYIEVDSMKIGTSIDNWDILDTEFNESPFGTSGYSKDGFVSWADASIRITRQETDGSYFVYRLPTAIRTGSIACQLRVRTNSMNCFMSLDGVAWQTKLVVCTNTLGHLYINNSNSTIFNDFADQEWHTVNLIINLDNLTTSIWVESENDTIWAYNHGDKLVYSTTVAAGEEGWIPTGALYNFTVEKSTGLEQTKDTAEGRFSVSNSYDRPLVERQRGVLSYQDLYYHKSIDSVSHTETQMVVGGIREKHSRIKNIITAFGKGECSNIVTTLPRGVYPGSGSIVAGSINDGYIVRYYNNDYIYWEMER